MKPSNYLPTLDGWRALSIVLVITHHSQLHGSAVLIYLNRIGEIGVELFFAISGLLICSRLLDEEAHFGEINLKNFYLRRCFRILPAALLYLVVIAILAAHHILPVSPLDWFAALFFFRNYVMVFEYLHHSPLALHWFTGHFWSLSLEEHFYLVLPAILVVFRKKRRHILVALAALIALWRFLLTHMLHRSYQINFRTDTHADALLIPALIALLLYPLLLHPSASRRIPSWTFPIFLLIEAFLLNRLPPFFFTLQAAVLPLLILSTLLHPTALPGRILEAKPLRWVGRISYSLYLWQQLFFGANFVGSPPHLVVLRNPPLNWIALFACACLSHYLLELPCIRLGHRLISATSSENLACIRTDTHTSPTPMREPG